MDSEVLLNELCASENVSHLSHMLTPTLDPWPSHLKYVWSFLLANSRFKVASQCDGRHKGQEVT